MSRHLAIGDIHGCLKALLALVDRVGIDSDDVVVAMGDYVDRGPDSCAVLDWLLQFSESHELIPLKGNHEVMMLDARGSNQNLNEWVLSGGDATLASYSPLDDQGKLVDVPDAHWEFLEHQLRDWYETDTHFFVHANAYPDLDLHEQPDYMLFWEKFNNPPPHESGKVMICGHTSQKATGLRHAICIDTWVYGKGWLTCLDVASGQYWQANQEGETRMSFLDPA